MRVRVRAMPVRPARPSDLDVIIQFIRDLALYEREPDAVVLERDELAEHLFGAPALGKGPRAEVLIAETDEGVSVGFALFFHNFSTWLGKPGLFLEDLFVQPEMRKQGFGKALLSACAKIAIDRGCARFEWAVLDWNQPAIDFYLALGSSPLSDWTTHRLTGAPLRALATLGKVDG